MHSLMTRVKVSGFVVLASRGGQDLPTQRSSNATRDAESKLMKREIGRSTRMAQLFVPLEDQKPTSSDILTPM